MPWTISIITDLSEGKDSFRRGPANDPGTRLPLVPGNQDEVDVPIELIWVEAQVRFTPVATGLDVDPGEVYLAIPAHKQVLIDVET